MKKPKVLTRQEAIRELRNRHGLDYLSANNIIHGRPEISELDLKAITQKISETTKIPLKKPRIKKIGTRHHSSGRVSKPNRLYAETKNYIMTLDWD